MQANSRDNTPLRTPATNDDEIAEEPEQNVSPEHQSTQSVGSRRSSRGSSSSSLQRRRLQRYRAVDIRQSQQVQMLSSFLNEHFPTAEAKAGLANRRSYLAALPDLDLSATPLLRMAIDTLCFAHVGTKTGDHGLIRESQASYGRVLSVLVQATRESSAATPPIDPKVLIPSIMVLCLYEDAIPVPHQGQNGWAAHYWGCQQILQIFGPGALNIDDPFDRLVFWNLRMPCFFLGVARRKAVALGRRDWLEFADQSVEIRGPLTDYYQYAMQVPALLERTDDLLNANTGPEALEQLCSDITQIKAGLASWFEARTSTQNSALVEIPEIVNVSDHATFDADNELHAFMVSSEAFDSVLRYRTPAHVAKNHTLYLLCYVVIECTILRLLHFQPASAAYFGWETVATVEKGAYKAGCDLCRAIFHYSRFLSLAEADFVEFIAIVGEELFEELNARNELTWCRGVRRATQLRIQRIKQTRQRKTLCRMADVAPGFARAMRFKTWDVIQLQPE